MRNPIEIAKEHPYLTGAGVFVVAVILVLVFASGSDTEEVSQPSLGGYNPTAQDPAAIQANAMLAQSQLAAQVQTRANEAKLAAEKDANATAAKVAVANFDYLTNKDVIAGKVAVRGHEANEFMASRAAEVSTAQIRAQADVANNATYAARDTALAGFSRDRYLADRAAEVENNRTSTAADIAKFNTQTAANLRVYEVHSQNYNTQLALEFQRQKDVATSANERLALEQGYLLQARKNELDFTSGNYAALLGFHAQREQASADKSAAGYALAGNVVRTIGSVVAR